MIEKMKWHPFDSERPDSNKQGKRSRESAEPRIDQPTADHYRNPEQHFDTRGHLRRGEHAMKKR